jgi:hypothetical protein
MPKLLLLTIAVVELGTGLALLIAPSLVVELLLGEGLSSPQSLVLGRITGAALVSIAVACWHTSINAPSSDRGMVGSLLIYNLAVPALLARAAITDGLRGIAIWPACVLHLVLGIWCLLCLRRR